MKKNVTIKEIAKKAEVSIATVSMVLNKKDKNISEATRHKVLAIAEAENYTPNVMARSLITRQTRTIGLIIPDITNPFFPEIARGVEDKASEQGYSVIYCNTDDKIKHEDKYIKILMEKMVDGIIFAHSGERDTHKSFLDNCRVPILLIDRDYQNKNVVGRVIVDNKQGSYEATSFLIKQGYKHIAYVAGPLKTNTALDRLSGYKDAISENLISVDPRLIKAGEYKLQWGIEAAKQLLSQDVKIDAIFCGNDLIAVGVMQELKEQGYSVPKDIGVIGFDDVYLANLVEPPLTTVRQPKYEMGYRAAEILIKSLERDLADKTQEIVKGGQEYNLLMETELIIRQSTRLQATEESSAKGLNRKEG